MDLVGDAGGLGRGRGRVENRSRDKGEGKGKPHARDSTGPPRSVRKDSVLPSLLVSFAGRATSRAERFGLGS